MGQEFKQISINNLKLDLSNPRLPKSKQDKDEATVIEFMLLEAATLELMMAIGENGFFAGEQLLVVPDKEDKTNYIVVEGNRRLTAVKLLSNPDLSKVKKESLKKICLEANFKPNEIPCLIFEEKQEILKYLGFRHITGIKSWRLLEKARYLADLKESEFQKTPFLEACREIAKMIGSSSSYIRRLLTGLNLYKIVEDEGYYQIDGLNDTKFHLNYFTDSLNKDNIRNYLGVNLKKEEPLKELNREHVEEITHWWFEKTEGKSRVLGNSEGLKMLDKVLGSEIALNAFKDGTPIEEAFEMTDELDVLFKKEVEKSLAAIEQADIYSNKVKEFYKDLYTDLKSIREVALKIRNYQIQKEQADEDF